jgi:hypothetical protein
MTPIVYQYVDANGRTMYVGYGESPSRAMRTR